MRDDVHAATPRRSGITHIQHSKPSFTESAPASRFARLSVAGDIPSDFAQPATSPAVIGLFVISDRSPAIALASFPASAGSAPRMSSAVSDDSPSHATRGYSPVGMTDAFDPVALRRRRRSDVDLRTCHDVGAGILALLRSDAPYGTSDAGDTDRAHPAVNRRTLARQSRRRARAHGQHSSAFAVRRRRRNHRDAARSADRPVYAG